MISKCPRYDYLFITCPPRAGTPLIMNSLKKSHRVRIMDEGFFLYPKWHSRDFFTFCKNYNFNTSESLNKFVDLLYTEKFKGWFWKKDIKTIDKTELKKKIESSNHTPSTILRILFQFYKGGKENILLCRSPADITKVSNLNKIINKSLIIHFLRSPFSVYSSMVVKEVNNNQDLSSFLSKIREVFIRFKRIFYLILTYKNHVSHHIKYNDNSNYYYLKMENLESNREIELRSLCKKIGIKYNKEMIFSAKSNTSYDSKTQSSKWRDYVSEIEITIISFFLKKELKILGYN